MIYKAFKPQHPRNFLCIVLFGFQRSTSICYNYAHFTEGKSRSLDGLTTDPHGSANNGSPVQKQSLWFALSCPSSHCEYIPWPRSSSRRNNFTPSNSQQVCTPKLWRQFTEVGEEHHCLATVLQLFWGLEACSVQLLFTGKLYLRRHASHKVMGWLSAKRQGKLLKPTTVGTLPCRDLSTQNTVVDKTTPQMGSKRFCYGGRWLLNDDKTGNHIECQCALSCLFEDLRVGPWLLELILVSSYSYTYTDKKLRWLEPPRRHTMLLFYHTMTTVIHGTHRRP